MNRFATGTGCLLIWALVMLSLLMSHPQPEKVPGYRLPFIPNYNTGK